ncbi:hypothetical protein AAY473_027827 [Plecturocebus cupreus]
MQNSLSCSEADWGLLEYRRAGGNHPSLKANPSPAQASALDDLRRSPSLLWASEKWGQTTLPPGAFLLRGLCKRKKAVQTHPLQYPVIATGRHRDTRWSLLPHPSQLAREPELRVLHIQTRDAPRSPAGRQHAGRFSDGEPDGPERGALAQGPAGAKCARRRPCERRLRSRGPGWDPGPLASRCVSSGRSPTLSEPEWIQALITEATALFPRWADAACPPTPPRVRPAWFRTRQPFLQDAHPAPGLEGLLLGAARALWRPPQPRRPHTEPAPARPPPPGPDSRSVLLGVIENVDLCSRG